MRHPYGVNSAPNAFKALCQPHWLCVVLVGKELTFATVWTSRKTRQAKDSLVKVPSGRAMAFPPNLQREVEAIQASSVPVSQQADSICKLLVKHGFAQHHQALTPASTLVHPSNRAGSMLSFHDVWSKGKQMLHVGMKGQLLEGSICCELSKDPDRRSQQLQVVQDAQGHLAPLSGQEGASVKICLVCEIFVCPQIN